jgi:hypothetical protein
MLATWVHLRDSQNYKKIDFTTYFKQMLTANSYGIGIGHASCCLKASKKCNSPMEEKKMNKNYSSSCMFSKLKNDHF